MTHHIGADQTPLKELLNEGNSPNVDRLTEGFTPEDLKRASNKILSMKGEIRIDKKLHINEKEHNEWLAGCPYVLKRP